MKISAKQCSSWRSTAPSWISTVMFVYLGASGCMAGYGDSQVGDDVFEVDVSVQELQTTRFADAFEANHLNQWTKTGVCATNTAAKYVGTYGARCDDNGSITTTIDMALYSNITVAYWRRTYAYDSGENFYVEWSADGVTWNLIEQTANNTTWTQKSFTLPVGANKAAALKIRFRSNASGSYERFDVDEVVITGDDGCVPSCTGKVCGNDGCGGNCGYCQANYMCTAGACEYGPASPVIFEETFENGLSNWTITNLGFGGCATNTGALKSGSYGLRCSDSPYISTTRSTTGYKDIKVEYWRRTVGFDNDSLGGYEWLYVEWSPDGGTTYYELEQARDTTYNFVNHNLPASADNLASFKLRFHANASISSEYFDADNIIIRGQPMTCTPNCTGLTCGADGCGGSCGTCASGTSCNNGSCACVPSCTGKNCGDDGCGGSCGTCATGSTCGTDRVCQSACTPSCTGKVCGDDGCGGTCGSCNVNEACSAGACACAPSCSGKTCGPDGCGGTCGTCATGNSCTTGGTCASTVSDPGATGPLSVCSYTTGLDNTGYASAIVSYPCGATTVMGATTLTGGYSNKKEDMAWLKDRVASHGYIVIAMTPTDTLGDTTIWYNAHKAGIDQLLVENNEAGSAIRGLVDPNRLQVMGFSKGGGGTIRAANNLGTKIKSAQALAPWLETSYHTTVWSGITARTAAYGGNSDTTATPANVRKFFDNFPTSIARLFVKYEGATHGHWYGAASTSNATPRVRFATHVVSWMKVYMDGNTAYQTYLNGTSYTSQKNATWYTTPDGTGTADGYTYYP